jgi:hypothetical protein
MNLSIFHTNSNDFAQYESLYNGFLKTIADTESPAWANMGEDTSSGLLFLVKNKKRWTKDSGQLTFLYDKDVESIVGVSGVEDCPLHSDIGSGGNRCWVLPAYRGDHTVSRYLLTSNLEWCRQNNKVGMLLTFNDYNKTIYDIIVRFSQGKGSALGSIWSDWWADCIPLENKIRLHNTPQWAVIKPLETADDILPIIDDLTEKFGVRNNPYNATV